MKSDSVLIPDLVPMLSRGKHRSPRKGACFMELASYLAGERWSDHPDCTHPLLAALARHVNDNSTDAGRQPLADLIPGVIGLVSDDLHVDVDLALRAATTALPIVSAERQQVLAVAVLCGNRVLGSLDGHPAAWSQQRSREMLAAFPHAARWAVRHSMSTGPSKRAFRRHAAPSTVRYAVYSIAASVPEPDPHLHDLLAASIEDCRALTGSARNTEPAVEVTAPQGASSS